MLFNRKLLSCVRLTPLETDEKMVKTLQVTKVTSRAEPHRKNRLRV